MTVQNWKKIGQFKQSGLTAHISFKIGCRPSQKQHDGRKTFFSNVVHLDPKMNIENLKMISCAVLL